MDEYIVWKNATSILKYLRITHNTNCVLPHVHRVKQATLFLMLLLIPVLINVMAI